MAIRTKNSIRDLFPNGGRPSQKDFEDWIDSALFHPISVSGVLVVESTASTSVLNYATYGLQSIEDQTRNSARARLGLLELSDSTYSLFITNATSSAYARLSISNTGELLLRASATSTALDSLDAGTVGQVIWSQITTASASTLAPAGDAALIATIAFSAANTAASLRQIWFHIPSTGYSKVEVWLDNMQFLFPNRRATIVPVSASGDTLGPSARKHTKVFIAGTSNALVSGGGGTPTADSDQLGRLVGLNLIGAKTSAAAPACGFIEYYNPQETSMNKLVLYRLLWDSTQSEFTTKHHAARYNPSSNNVNNKINYLLFNVNATSAVADVGGFTKLFARAYGFV